MSLSSPYQNLWFSTEQLIKKFKPSLSNYFDVHIPRTFGGVSNDSINFLAYDAVLPGSSYELSQVYGDRQGRIEQYPTRRIYPAVDVSFYIDYDYEVLQYFEQWMAAISPNIGDRTNSYVKFNYPNTYEVDIQITKFERLFRDDANKLVKDGVYAPPKTYATYTLRNSYPTNIISVPVSYEGTNVLRTTITFNYDVYSFQRIKDPFGTEGGGSNTTGPGKDPKPNNVPISGTSRERIPPSRSIDRRVEAGLPLVGRNQGPIERWSGIE